MTRGRDVWHTGHVRGKVRGRFPNPTEPESDKMKNTGILAAACAAAVVATGCLSAPFKPPMGLYSEVSAPLSTEGPIQTGTKTGEATAKTILGLVATGDCSINTAAKNGGLRKINHVDYRYKNILGIVQETTVVVYGE